MDFIGGCEGRWQRNKVAQPKAGRAGFDTRTHRRVDGSKGNGEVREEVAGVVHREYHPPRPFFLPRSQMQVRDFRSAGVNSRWVMFLVDRRAYTCRISDALAICMSVQPDVQIISPIHPLRLQVRIGGFSPHARSLTPAWRLFRRREGSNVLLMRYVHPLGCLRFNQTS